MRFQNQLVDVINSQRKFENNINITHRKDYGVFLTNNIEIVDRILNIIDFDDSELLLRKFLEPSCGNGIFIVRLLERIFENINDAMVVSDFIEYNIFFIDIDEKMVETTTSNIEKFYRIKFNEDYKGNFNAFIFDYTLRLKPKNNNLLFLVLLNQALQNLKLHFQ